MASDVERALFPTVATSFTRCYWRRQPLHATKVPTFSASAAATTCISSSALKEQGNSAFARKAFDEAVQLYSAALAADDTPPEERAKLLLNRSNANFSRDNYDASHADALAAVALQPRNPKGKRAPY